MMSNQPYLSVCFPAYNKSDRLKKNLASLLNACGDDIEIVVVDNVSEENLEEVCKNFNDPRISYYRNEEPIVAQANWIRSIRLAKGQWALLMMDRDLINGKGIPPLMEELKKCKAFGAGKASYYADGTDKIYAKCPKIGSATKHRAGAVDTLLAVNWNYHPSGNLYNKDFLKLSEDCESAIMQNPRLKENTYLMLRPAWNHGLLVIQTDMIYTPWYKHLAAYKSGFKSSHVNMKGVNYYGYYTLEGFLKYIREDLEEIQKLGLSSEEKKEFCVRAYNGGYIKERFLALISISRGSYIWKHYNEKYKYRTWKEEKKLASELCENYKEAVKTFLGDDAEDVLSEIEPIRVEWSTHMKLTIAAIPVIGPFLLKVKHWLVRS